MRTYEDLRRDPRYCRAIEFFVSDLYGPQDLSGREGELERAWHYLKHALPDGLLALLTGALELQVLTKDLDWQMAALLPSGEITPGLYRAAYRQVDSPAQRTRQIDLVVVIGEGIERAAKSPWVPLALRAAHGPARFGGFGRLQDFLERGFSAFRAMGGAEPFLEHVRFRETRLMHALLWEAESVGIQLLETISDAEKV